MPRPKTPGEMVAAIQKNLVEKTGKSWDQWMAIAKKAKASKESELRPLFDALLRLGLGLGKDVEVKPCATYVPLIRRSQFAAIQPSTRDRIDLGLVLKGIEAEGRLEPAKNVGGGSITHRIRIEKKSDIDAATKHWLKTAYEANGR